VCVCVCVCVCKVREVYPDYRNPRFGSEFMEKVSIGYDEELVDYSHNPYFGVNIWKHSSLVKGTWEALGRDLEDHPMVTLSNQAGTLGWEGKVGRS
jgi:hypothetical protein